MRTQAEAKSSGDDFEPIEVPTDARGLVEYLNKIREVALPPVSPYEQGATKILSGMDDGTNTTEQVVESIMTCGRYTLGRYAMAVSLRFGQMEKGKRS